MAAQTLSFRPIPLKQRVLVETLRTQITSGEMAPGARLPTRGELQQKFNASTHTVQRAMDRLLRDGFIESRGTLGTFVSNSPPHLCHYGLVFPSRPRPDSLWSRFFVAMQQVATGLHDPGHRDITFYYGDEPNRGSKELQGLSKDIHRDVRNHRLAGLIFASHPFYFLGTPVLEQKGIPKIAIMAPAQSPEGSPFYDFPAIYPSLDAFYSRALDYLKSCGRRRVGFLSMDPSLEKSETLRSGLRDRGMTTQPYWNLVFHKDLAWAAQNATLLMMRWSRSETPDSLVISDDNLVEPVVAGLIAAGIRVPDDVEVVSYCNFPAAVRVVLPIKRIGCDCVELMKDCLDILEMQRNGIAPPPMTWVEPKFEEELAPAPEQRTS